MKLLFIGGTGIISSACSELALAKGYDLYLLNRGESVRPAPKGAHVIHGDIRDEKSMDDLFRDMMFDVVVNWIAFVPQHIETDLRLFSGKTGQYIFISSASAYQTPPNSLPVVESTPLHNPYWQYSRDKIACEERLLRAYREDNFPATIVRPSHTYDKTLLPFSGHYTVLDRMRRGKKVIVHGDGTSLWVLTHHRDFAVGFTGLLGNPQAVGEAFHITSDEILTWNQIYHMVAAAAGFNPHLIHIPSDFINHYDKDWGAGLLGDKAHSMLFDNSKIKRFVPEFKAVLPFARGAEEIVKWFNEDESRKMVDNHLDTLYDTIITAFESGYSALTRLEQD
jgi:nucleoside-diphosphate-sugar epimerase